MCNKKGLMLRCYIVTKPYLWRMMEYFIGQSMLLGMMETLKKQMECVDYTFSLYAHNAQLLSIATQSVSLELSLLNMLNASLEGRCQAPWKVMDVRRWKEWLADFDTGEFWGYYMYEEDEDTFPLPTDDTLFRTLLQHHVFKEREDGRGFYGREDVERFNNNANALDFALNKVAFMSPYYAAEVAEDAVLQLGVTFAELERLMLENDAQSAKSFVDTRIKAGRKAVSCFTQKVSEERLQMAFRRFMQGISAEGGRVRLGHQEYDCKYVFVLLCYRFIDAGLMLRKLNVTCFSSFIVNALGLEVNFPSFRKNMNNWMQKIDLYECTFSELTREQISHTRYHEQQLTLDEYEVWLMVDSELEKAIAESGAFDGLL